MNIWTRIKGLLDDDRAYASNFVILIASFFLTLFIYIFFGELYNVFYPLAVAKAPAGALDPVNITWEKFPIIVVVWAVVYGVLSGLRREPYTYR